MQQGETLCSAAPMPDLAIALVYDLLGRYPRREGDPEDVDAEYEPESTVCVLERALSRLGHRSVRIGSPHDLLTRIGRGGRPRPPDEQGSNGGMASDGALPGIDAALNLAEGYGSRNREAWAPVLLEMAGVPTLGSDALTLSTTLDKLWASQRVEAAGVPVPRRAVVASGLEARTLDFTVPFPLFVKPRWEGTSKGIGPGSRVADRPALEAEVDRIRRDYRQPALVEMFLEGPEFTVTLVGNDPPRALPVLQRALEETTQIGLHALERHPAPAGGWRYDLPGCLDDALESELARLALRAYEVLECRDFARADFRLDGKGRPHFLEMNPLPTFAPDGSFGILAELEGRELEDLLGEILDIGLTRLGLS